MGKDYIYAVTPLLEDALMDRDLVHRQTACTTVKRKFIDIFLSQLLNIVMTREMSCYESEQHTNHLSIFCLFSFHFQ